MKIILRWYILPKLSGIPKRRFDFPLGYGKGPQPLGRGFANLDPLWLH